MFLKGGHMKHLIPFIIVIFSAFTWNCGESIPEVNQGDLLRVIKGFQGNFETEWEEDSYSEGFTKMIPEGTVLRVVISVPTSRLMTCTPFRINGNEDIRDVAEFFIPPHIINRRGLLSYTIELVKTDMGIKFEKLR